MIVVRHQGLAGASFRAAWASFAPCCEPNDAHVLWSEPNDAHVLWSGPIDAHATCGTAEIVAIPDCSVVVDGLGQRGPMPRPAFCSCRRPHSGWPTLLWRW